MVGPLLRSGAKLGRPTCADRGQMNAGGHQPAEQRAMAVRRGAFLLARRALVAAPSSSTSIVVAEHPPESLSAAQLTRRTLHFFPRLDQTIVQTLMVSLSVIMFAERLDGLTKGTVVPENVIRSRCEEWNAVFRPTISLSQRVLSEFIQAGWRLRLRTRSGGFTMECFDGQTLRGKVLHRLPKYGQLLSQRQVFHDQSRSANQDGSEKYKHSFDDSHARPQILVLWLQFRSKVTPSRMT